MVDARWPSRPFASMVPPNAGSVAPIGRAVTPSRRARGRNAADELTLCGRSFLPVA
jgi:hypothetical protein